MVFLIGAFMTAIGLMFAILLTQFNSFYQAFVVMSAIVFSVAGVLLGLIGFRNFFWGVFQIWGSGGFFCLYRSSVDIGGSDLEEVVSASRCPAHVL